MDLPLGDFLVSGESNVSGSGKQRDENGSRADSITEKLAFAR